MSSTIYGGTVSASPWSGDARSWVEDLGFDPKEVARVTYQPPRPERREPRVLMFWLYRETDEGLKFCVDCKTGLMAEAGLADFRKEVALRLVACLYDAPLPHWWAKLAVLDGDR